MSKPLATVRGTMLTPGISRNGRLYTKEIIAKAVGRMRERIADPNGLPIVMRTHHDAGDDSTLIVGRITDVDLDENGSANYKAALYNTGPAKNIAGLVVGDKPALKSVSIHGYWLGPVRKVRQGGQMATTADDLEIDAVDFTHSPGVTGAVVTQASYVGDDAMQESTDGRVAITESMEAEIEAIDETVDEVTGWIGERYNTAQRKAMAGKGQAMQDGSYPIANKSDLRHAIRAVGRGGASHNAIRKFVMSRAKALGLTNMVPDTWNADGSTNEAVPQVDSVSEGHVVICVNDDYGNEIVKVCAANVDRKTLKKAGKQALKLAARIVDKSDDDAIDFDGDDAEDQAQAAAGEPDDDTDDVGGGIDDVKGVTVQAKPAVPDAKVQKMTNPTFVVKPGSDPQANPPSFENVRVYLDGKDITESVTVTAETSDVSASETDASTVDVGTEDAAMADDKQAVEQAAPSGLTEADVTKIGAVIGESIKQAMLAMAQQRADAKAAKKAAKESVKNDAETKADETTEPTKVAVTEAKAGVSEAELKEMFNAERDKIKAELRESIIKESGLPSRKGFRHVAESDTDVTPTGDDLWDKRGEIWAQLLPLPQPATVPAAADSNES